MGLRSLKRLIPEQHPLRLAWHKTKALAAALRYGFPARQLTVVGVTGTDGKTTTVGMIAHILQHAGIHAGSLSTAVFMIDGKAEWNATQKTSPSPFTVQRFLRRLVSAGCTHAVVEYSSHGLVQGRNLFTFPHVAAMTNTSPEHLDYHGSLEEYRRAKSLLFRMLHAKGVKVLNRDDGTYEAYRTIPSEVTFTYGSAAPPTGAMDEDWQLTDIAGTVRGCSAAFASKKGKMLPLALPIAGTFNLMNAACALLCCKALKIEEEIAAAALSSFTGVPGRIERIDEGQDFNVFVDFTVTPASYAATLGTLRSSLPHENRLLVLMGSCGDRMKEKRPLIGKIAGDLADIIVVTNEDPYSEDPKKIIDEVLEGTAGTSAQAHRIIDRREAMAFLFAQAKPGDAVVLCGKGSDTTMWVKGGKIPWNEREIARELLHSIRQP